MAWVLDRRLWLYRCATFLGALLLFGIQPLVAKSVLPSLGGSSAVWSTCLVFFQALLLAGYAYAHGSISWLKPRWQILTHLMLVALPLLLLPLALAPLTFQAPAPPASPLPWLLAFLAVSVGLPFFVVATSAPVLQSWFSRVGHRHSHDPYFLYAASNLGSLLALLGYPFLVEPHFRLSTQNRLWSGGYVLYAVLIAICALTIGRGAGTPPAIPLGVRSGKPSVSLRRRLSWLALSAIPSSLMLGMTSYLTNDIASVPLLWTVPLAIYLLTYTMAFSCRFAWLRAWCARLMPEAIALAVFAYLIGPIQLLGIPAHLVAFFVGAMACHGALANARPQAERLTEFYLWISVGGALGGLFNATVAPLVFDRVVEYPLALLLVSLLGRNVADLPGTRRQFLCNLAAPLTLGALAAAAVVGVRALGYEPWGTTLGVIFGIVLVLALIVARTPIRLALAIAILFAISGVVPDEHGRVLRRERSFYGALRITELPGGQFYELVHGTTIHGRQSRNPARAREPLTYYHPSGPFGLIYQAYRPHQEGKPVAVVGLGVGSMASYADPSQTWTFYEIDPAVERVARDPRYFTYLRDCQAGELRILIGDGRVRLREAADRSYGLIVVDAFNSDAIPVHLFSREALALYVSKLSDRGVIALHISNRFFNFIPVLSALVDDAHLVGMVSYDERPPDESGRLPSLWAVIGRRSADLGALVHDRRWLPLRNRRHAQPWTDDYSDLLSILMP